MHVYSNDDLLMPLLGKIGSAEVVPDLLRVLETRSCPPGPGSRVRTVQALADLGPEAKGAVTALVRLMENKPRREEDNPDLWQEAAFALAEIDRDAAARSARAMLFECAGSKKEPIRRRAARALGKLGLEVDGVTQKLFELLSDRERGVRAAAGEAFRTMGHAAVRKLLPLLQDKNWLARWSAARALAELGPQATDAVPALTLAASDPDPDVWRAAENALRRIRGPQ